MGETYLSWETGENAYLTMNGSTEALNQQWKYCGMKLHSDWDYRSMQN